MATPIRLYLENPPDSDDTYASIQLERAPDAAGVPGAFALVSTTAIDPKHDYTFVEDAGGSALHWYRYRYVKTGGDTSAVYKPSATGQQGGIFAVRGFVKSEIPNDPDLTDPLIDQWIDLAFGEMYGLGIWTPVETTLTITAEAGDVTQAEMEYALDRPAIDVYEVWENYRSPLQTRRSELVDGWTQSGNKVRFPLSWTPTIGGSYLVVAKGEYSDVGQLTNDYLPILSNLVFAAYAMWKRKQMANFKPFDSKVSEISMRPGDLKQLADDHRAIAEKLASRVANEEPPKGQGRAY